MTADLGAVAFLVRKGRSFGFRRSRKRKRTNRENPRKNRESPTQDKEGQIGTEESDLCWYSAKRAGVKRVCPKKVMAHIWFMHDARLGRAFLSLDMLAECTLLSMTVMFKFMSLVCSWNEVGMSYVQVSSNPFCTRPFWRMPSVCYLGKRLMGGKTYRAILGGGGETYHRVRPPKPVLEALESGICLV